MAAHDLVRLREEHVGLVINCTTNTPLPPWAGEPATPTLDVMAVCGEEVRSAMRSTGIVHLLDPLLDRIQHLLTSNVSVMIHCRAGVHRAGALGVILAMHFLNLNPRDALAHARHRRRMTNVQGDTWQVVLRYAAAAEGTQATPAKPADPEDPAEPTVLAEASWLVSLSESELEDDARDDPWVRVEPATTSLNPPPPMVFQTKAPANPPAAPAAVAAAAAPPSVGPPPEVLHPAVAAATVAPPPVGPPPVDLRPAVATAAVAPPPVGPPPVCLRPAAPAAAAAPPPVGPSHGGCPSLGGYLTYAAGRASQNATARFKDWHSGSSSGWQQ